MTPSFSCCVVADLAAARNSTVGTRVKDSISRRELMSALAVSRASVLIDPSFVIEPSMICARRHDKVCRINATFRSAIVMQLFSWLKFTTQQLPNETMHPGATTATTTEVKRSVAPAVNGTQPEPTARIGLYKNKISNALRESAKLNLNHTGPQCG